MLLMLLNLACTSPENNSQYAAEPQLAGGRLSIDTSAGWSLPAWAVKRDRLQIIKTQARIQVPKDRPLKGAALLLEGAWYQIELTVNGQKTTSINGGLMPNQIPIGHLIKPGENHFDLTISPPPPNRSSRLTGGRLFATHKNAAKAKLMRPPTLILRPNQHIENMALALDKEKVTPKARVKATNGSSVQFEIWLDGKRMANLGTGTVMNEMAVGPASTWTLPKWNPNAPNLFMLKGTLIDKAGNQLDSMVTKTGVKQTVVQSNQLRWNGKVFEMFAARLQGHDSPKSLGERLLPMIDGGINGVEIHGEMLRSDWLDYFDENGIPVAFTPRCIGRTNYKTDSEIDLTILENQDHRFIRAIESRPSIAIGVVEGKDSIKLWTNELQKSLNQTPIMGIDGSAGHIQIDMEKDLAACRPKTCRNHWIVEVALSKETDRPPWNDIVSRFESLINEGIIGSVIPLPRKILAKLNPQRDKEWASAWKRLAKSKRISPLNGATHRAKSKVIVEGLQPGNLVIAGSEGLEDRAVVADADGKARLELWHRGEIQIKSGETKKIVSLMPSVWRQYKWEGTTTTVNWSQ